MATGKREGRNTLPRVNSIEGIDARVERRLKAFVPQVSKGGSGSTQCHKPGSRNPRKVGR